MKTEELRKCNFSTRPAICLSQHNSIILSGSRWGGGGEEKVNFRIAKDCKIDLFKVSAIDSGE